MPAVMEEGRQAHSIPILPHSQEGDQNTINRAELVGILVALKWGATKILTDSASSICQIRKHMFRPQDQDIHRHKDLLDDIVTRIKDAEGPVFIGKVKSHIGIVGNERADEIAVNVAKGRTDPDDCEEYWEVSNKRRYMYWPHHVTQETKRVRTYEQGQPVWKETSVTRKRPLQDLKQDTHELGRKHRRLGRANRNTIRFEAWNDVQADLHEATYHVDNSAQIKAKERLTAKKYRQRDACTTGAWHTCSKRQTVRTA